MRYGVIGLILAAATTLSGCVSHRAASPELLAALDSREISDASPSTHAADDVLSSRLEQLRRWDLQPAKPINDLAKDLQANRNLLAALAGPSNVLTMDIDGGALPVWLTGEDLTRLLVNLVKNAAEAMPATGGSIHIDLRERLAEQEATPWLVLTIEDSGPGIPEKALDKIFESGYTTRLRGAAASRGLGLFITRSLVEAAGGRIHAANRAQAGACFAIELPVRMR